MQYDAVQSPSRAPIRLSARDIRRLLWSTVGEVVRPIAQALHWSWWRRWHQAWAVWHHMRGRAALLPPNMDANTPPPKGPVVVVATSEPHDAATTDATIARVWNHWFHRPGLVDTRWGTTAR
ncbi:hypothetical protein [Roseiflexus sp.]|uniref:hypothetical protein n=1 Tax=Roseiflexus sp. TaxID=2562120 RepID=UPI00398BA1CB